MVLHKFHRSDLDPETWDLVLEVELAGQEALLSLHVALVKPKQDCSLVSGSDIALLLLSSVMSMFKTAAYFTFIYCGF